MNLRLCWSQNLQEIQNLSTEIGRTPFRSPEDCPELFRRAAALLRGSALEGSGSGTLRDLERGSLTLHSRRPLLWLFRHALRQGARSVPPDDASAACEAVAALVGGGPRDGEQVPIVIDLGCGFGVSSLGILEGAKGGPKERGS